jgi:hypothetical protein
LWIENLYQSILFILYKNLINFFFTTFEVCWIYKKLGIFYYIKENSIVIGDHKRNEFQVFLMKPFKEPYCGLLLFFFYCYYYAFYYEESIERRGKWLVHGRRSYFYFFKLALHGDKNIIFLVLEGFKCDWHAHRIQSCILFFVL